MFTSIMNRWWWAGLLVSAQLVNAQPSGQAAFPFDAEDAPVWDLGGGYTFDTPMLGAGDQEVPLSYSVQIDHLARGPLQGQGTAIVHINGQPVAGSYTVRGSVSGGGSLTRVNFSVNLRGRDWISGALRSFTVRASYRLEVDPAARAMSGRVSGSVSISGLGGGAIRDDAFSMPVPAGADGSWSVAVNFIPFKSFSGTGTVSVSRAVPPDNPAGWPTEHVMAASVKGSYSSKSDLTKLSVRTLYGGDSGASVNLTFSGNNQLKKLRGKVLGQSVTLDK